MICLPPLNRTMMKAFHQAPVVGHAFPSCQKPCVSFSSRPYRQSSHQLQLVAAKDTFMYNNKYRRLMVTVSSLSGMPYEKFHESAYDLCKDSSLESLKIVQVFSAYPFYSILRPGFEIILLVIKTS